MTTDDLKPGTFITPNVKLQRPLAEGGMGRVWVAEHLGLHCQVVVKVMAEEMAQRPDGAERFAREAAAAAAIKSPHIIQVFDHGMTPKGPHGEPSVPYMVMELLEGKDLGAHILEHGPVDPLDVVSIVMQIGKALSKAHKANIVHRDIKPDNIFLCDTDDGQIFVKLLDFGTAKKDDKSQASRTTVPGQIMGTPYYMSPEQSVGADIDERSDIWSLGVVVFEALTGQKPFDGGSIGAITIAIHGPLPKVTERAPENVRLPATVDEWFARACAQAPSDRFASIREATEAFVLAITGNSFSDQPTESLLFPFGVRSSVDVNAGRTLTSDAPRSLSDRPVEPLIASLPERGSERRPTTIAAGIVAAAAALAMAGILIHRSPAPASAAAFAAPEAVSPPAAATAPPAPVASSEPPPAEATPPADRPAPPLEPPSEPEPSIAAKAPRTNAAARPKGHSSKPLARNEAKPPSSTQESPKTPPPSNDDDLVRLTQAAAKHSSAQVPTPSPAPENVKPEPNATPEATAGPETPAPAPPAEAAPLPSLP